MRGGVGRDAVAVRPDARPPPAFFELPPFFEDAPPLLFFEPPPAFFDEEPPPFFAPPPDALPPL